jgi:hypothetical protein
MFDQPADYVDEEQEKKFTSLIVFCVISKKLDFSQRMYILITKKPLFVFLILTISKITKSFVFGHFCD